MKKAMFMMCLLVVGLLVVIGLMLKNSFILSNYWVALPEQSGMQIVIHSKKTPPLGSPPGPGLKKLIETRAAIRHKGPQWWVSSYSVEDFFVGLGIFPKESGRRQNL